MNLKTDFKTDWISGALSNEAITFAEKFGTYLCDLREDKFKKDALRLGGDAMTTSQIRNFFGEVKRIQLAGFEQEHTAFLLIRPKLAYAEARALQKNSGSRLKDFRFVMDRAHQAVNNETQFQNFVYLLESILAYHKASGGRD